MALSQVRAALAVALGPDMLQAHPAFAAAVPAPLITALLNMLGEQDLPPTLRATCAQVLINVVACLSRPTNQQATPNPSSLDELLAEPFLLQRSLAGALDVGQRHPQLAAAALDLLARVLQMDGQSLAATKAARAVSVRGLSCK